MRSVGIPVTTGSIPHWGHSNNSHAFNLLNGEDGNYYDFAGGEHHPGDHLKRFDGIPKVYQKTFSVQQTSLVMTNTSKEEIPAFFKNPFMKDITEHFPAIHPQTVSIVPRTQIPRTQTSRSHTSGIRRWQIPGVGLCGFPDSGRFIYVHRSSKFQVYHYRGES